ncbi:MAG: SpoIIE family protein phosphatase [Ruminococcus sp.]|nr:SpoIIE family protein phosphatase [Ruminococcus sp.]
MRKWLGLTIGGLQQKILNLVLIFMLAMIGVFSAVSFYQSKKLTKTVKEARDEQQQAIETVSQDTMHQVINGTLVKTTALQAYIADDMFADLKSDVMTMQTLAQQLFSHKDTITPHPFSLPDASKNGQPTAQVLHEKGVDYKNSKYLGVAAHMSESMIAMYKSSGKLSNCFIGLADGTNLCVDELPANKYDKNGTLSDFPVRERPWYISAAEKKQLCFSGIEYDTYTRKLCVTCSAPVIVDGELYGVVGADIFLDAMDDYVKNAANSTGLLCVINNEGQVIFSSDGGSAFKVETAANASDLRKSANTELADFVTNSLKQRTELTQITVNNKPYYAAGAPMETVGWTVVTLVDKQATEMPAQQMIDQYDEINRNAQDAFDESSAWSKTTTMIMIALLLILGSATALWVASKIVKPVETMTNDIIDGGKTGKLFEMKEIYKTNDEIEVLAQSFDDLTKKVVQYIKDITQITKEKERIGTELELARKIQADMLPNIYPAFPDRPEFDIYASMRPAKEVGGDFYDFYLIDKDHLGMVIADVSGKGVPAALFMMMSRILIKNYAMMGYSPAQVLEQTNNSICMNNKEDMFVTVWYGVLEISTGKITAANAGHEFPIIKKQGGKFELLQDEHGFVIGGMEGMKYKEYEIQLDSGEMLFLYTDGVPEATDGENNMYGTDRLLEAMNSKEHTDPLELLGSITDNVDQFVGEADRFDDMTMLAVTIK